MSATMTSKFRHLRINGLNRKVPAINSVHYVKNHAVIYTKFCGNAYTNVLINSNSSFMKCGYKHFSATNSLSSYKWETVSVTGSCSSAIEIKEDGLLLKYGDYELDLLYIWLRDHCHCDVCYNHSTYQKNVDNYTLSPDEIPSSIEFDGVIMTITWSDGHITSYNINWLLENSFHTGHKDRIEKVIWDKSTMLSLELPTVQYQKYMASQEGLRKHLLNMIKFGFSIITEVPPNHEGTIEVSNKLSFPQATHFGETWTFTGNNERGDTAYTNMALGAHTDTTYFTAPSGIQVFHVLEHSGTGGETLLVDGQHCANMLKAKHPESYELLTKCVIPHEYFEPGIKIRSLGTVLSVHPTTGDFAHIRFNPYDRSPLYTLPADEQRAFYRAYSQLTSVIQCPDNEIWFKLLPDMVLFVDNWRVLHGRASFTGQRRVSGQYLTRDDYISKARGFGILTL